MGLLTRLLTTEVQAATPAPWDDYWYGPIMQPSVTGMKVTPDTAMTTSAVYACVRFIAETIATLPLHMYRARADGGKDRADNHPIADVIAFEPNVWQTAVEFWEMMVGHAVLRGNGIAQIMPGKRGFVDQLIPIHPDRCKTPERQQNGRLRYPIKQEDGTYKSFDQAQIFHLPGLTSDGLWGISPVSLARDSIGLAMATESHGGRFFSQNASPGGVLEHPGSLGEAAYNRVRDSWNARTSGLQNAMKTTVLEEGMKWHQVGMSNEDSQFLETRKFQISDIARWFRVPPHLIGDLERSTFNNIEHQGIEVVVYTIRPWVVRIEQRIRRSLILNPETYFASFVIDGLLRGDAVTRATAFQIMRQNGALNADEWRGYENLNPIPDGSGKVYLQQSNNVPLGTEPQPAAPPAKQPNAQTRTLAEDAAARIVRKEIVAVRKNAQRLADRPEDWHAWLLAFYDEIAAEVVKTLHVSEADAERYAAEQRDALSYHGLTIMEAWEPQRAYDLAALMLGEEPKITTEPVPLRSRKTRKTGTIGGRAIDLVEEEIA